MEPRRRDAPDDIAETTEILVRERPELSPDAFDRVRRRVHARAPVRRAPSLAVSLCLAFGVLFATTGSGLALSGLADSGQAVQAQYPDNRWPAHASPSTTARSRSGQRQRDGDVRRTEDQREDTDRSAPPVTLGGSEREMPPPVAPPGEDAARQVEATTELPFTGYEAIPILLLGIALLATGLALRRRSRLA
jgi:hypothetical protein